MDTKKFKLNDSVWHRVVQIIQEAMIMQVDCVDLLRMIEVEISNNDELTLTNEYVTKVDKMHEKWLQEVEKLHNSNQEDYN